MLLCLPLTFALTAPASADTFTVNTTADTTVAGGCDTNPTCSIRDALALANAGAGHTVSVPSGTYLLSMGELFMGSDTRLVGEGARSTIIDAQGNSRVIFAGGDNYIEGITATGGRATFAEILVPPGIPFETDPGYGGGILSSGGFMGGDTTLVLVDSTVTDNSAEFGGGGVATASIHGGDAGPMTITGSTISGNRVEGGAGSGRGGGVASFDTLTMTNTTVTGNSVDNPGFVNQGAGVSAASAGAFLNNVTITNNTSVSGVDAGAGIAGDDLGVPPLDSELTATNTIVAGNTHAGSPSDCGVVDLQASDNNISSDDSCDFNDAGSKENTDPQLGALGNNGGRTDTRKFVQGAPPYNAGVAAGCPATDQRGVARPQQGTCDIGAVEIAPPTAITGDVTGLTSTSATILGTSINPFVAAGTSSFEFGTSTAYGQTIAAGAVAAGATESESGPVSGLAPETLYHYRAVAQNGDGIGHGVDRTFTTPATGASLRRPTVSVSGVRRSCVRRAFTLRVRARVSSGTRLKAVRVTLDGRTIKRTTRRSFTVRVNAQRLSSGRHTLRIKAVDRGNRTRTVTRRFSRCARVPVANPRFTG